MNHLSLALLVVSTLLTMDASSATAARWGEGQTSDVVGATEHRCVQVLQVKTGESQIQESHFSPPGLDLELAALALGEEEDSPTIGGLLYVESLIYNEGRVEVIRSWLNNRVCQ